MVYTDVTMRYFIDNWFNISTSVFFWDLSETQSQVIIHQVAQLLPYSIEQPQKNYMKFRIFYAEQGVKWIDRTFEVQGLTTERLWEWLFECDSLFRKKMFFWEKVYQKKITNYDSFHLNPRHKTNIGEKLRKHTITATTTIL